MVVKDISGQKFGRLTVKSLSHVKKNAYWTCICDCGKEIVAIGNNLKRMKTLSCGCLKREVTGARVRKHGDSNTRFYAVWTSIKHRTLNPNSEDYKNYGERGISMCNRWLSYNNFKSDMFESYLRHVCAYGEKDTTIERIENNSNYEPSNCRWATKAEQTSNHRRNRIIVINKEALTLAQTARKYSINRSTLSDRLNKGMPIERALERSTICII